MLGCPKDVLYGRYWFQLRVLSTILVKLLTCVEGRPPHEVEEFGLGQGLTVLSSTQHL